MQAKYGTEQFLVVGVTPATEEAARQFMLELGATYPILSGASESFESWGVSSIPQAYLIDPSGKVVADGIDDIPALLDAAL